MNHEFIVTSILDSKGLGEHDLFVIDHLEKLGYEAEKQLTEEEASKCAEEVEKFIKEHC